MAYWIMLLLPVAFTIPVFPGHARACFLTLTANQVIFVHYPHPFPDTIRSHGTFLPVNEISVYFDWQALTGGEILHARLYGDEGAILADYRKAYSGLNPSIGIGISLYDLDNPFPWAPKVDLDQFRDGVGDDRFTFSLEVIQGSLELTDIGLGFFHDYLEDGQFFGTGRYVQRSQLSYQVAPVPGAIWLLGSCLIGLLGLRRKRSKS